MAGLGAAGLFSGALSMIAVCVPIERRAVYVGSIASMFGVAAICGPLLGGVFTDKVSWRWLVYCLLLYLFLTLSQVLLDQPPFWRACIFSGGLLLHNA